MRERTLEASVVALLVVALAGRVVREGVVAAKAGIGRCASKAVWGIRLRAQAGRVQLFGLAATIPAQCVP